MTGRLKGFGKAVRSLVVAICSGVKSILLILGRRGFFLKEIFSGFSACIVLFAGYQMYKVAFLPDVYDERAALTSEQIAAFEQSKVRAIGAGFPPRSYNGLQSAAVQVLSNCPSVKSYLRVVEEPEGLQFEILIQGAVSAGCNRHMVYLGADVNNLEVELSSGSFESQVLSRFPRIQEDADNLATIVEVNIDNDRFDYWGLERGSETEGWLQARISFDTKTGLARYDDLWLLPDRIEPRSSVIDVHHALQGGKLIWHRYLSNGCDTNCFTPSSGSPEDLLSEIEANFYYSDQVTFSLYPRDPAIDFSLSGSRAKGERHISNDRQTLLYTRFPASDNPHPIYSQRFAESRTLQYEAGALVYSQAPDLLDRRQAVSALAGVMIGFGLALAVETLILLIWRLENSIRRRFGGDARN